MKVLENNNYVEVVCPHCKSRLGVHKDDIRYNEMAHHCSEFEVSCGACGKTAEVKRSIIPSGWINSIVPDDTGH